MKIEIKKVEIQLGDMVLLLTLDEIRELKALLKRIAPDDFIDAFRNQATSPLRGGVLYNPSEQ